MLFKMLALAVEIYQYIAILVFYNHFKISLQVCLPLRMLVPEMPNKVQLGLNKYQCGLWERGKWFVYPIVLQRRGGGD